MKYWIRLAFGVALAAAAPVKPLVLTPLSIDQLTEEAALVVQGIVRAKTVQRDSTGRIYTRIEFEVLDAWKGVPDGNPLLVVQGGGTLGEQKAIVSGQAFLGIGEEAVLFLVRNVRGEAVVIGLSQGKFSIEVDRKSGARYVHNLFHGRPPPRDVPAAVASRESGLISLNALKAHVQKPGAAAPRSSQ